MSYSEVFLDNGRVELPRISMSEQEKIRALGLSIDSFKLNYLNYSLIQNPFRKFPYFTATNVNGKLFKSNVERKDNWKKDERIDEDFQFGKELYDVLWGDFHRGHMTRLQDVQWGETENEATEAVNSTFYFTNAVPQINRLNQGTWRRIEDYILHQETVKNKMKVSIFNGPILRDDDPQFLGELNGETIQLPYLFWKVVYYEQNEKLYRTAFLTSQVGLMKKRRVIKQDVRGEIELRSDLFLAFKDAETYQVRVDLIEKIGDLKFQKAQENYCDETPEEIKMKGIDVRSDKKEINYVKVRSNIIL